MYKMCDVMRPRFLNSPVMRAAILNRSSRAHCAPAAFSLEKPCLRPHRRRRRRGGAVPGRHEWFAATVAAAEAAAAAVRWFGRWLRWWLWAGSSSPRCFSAQRIYITLLLAKETTWPTTRTPRLSIQLASSSLNGPPCTPAAVQPDHPTDSVDIVGDGGGERGSGCEQQTSWGRERGREGFKAQQEARNQRWAGRRDRWHLP